MRKFYLLTFAAACCFSLAQAQEKHYLRAINSTVSQLEYNKYFYDSEGRTDSIHWSDELAEGSVKLTYDEAGNVVQRDMFQLIDFNNSYTDYVAYQYDDAGRVTMRQNYHDYGWGFQRQGTKVYTYEGDLLMNITTWYGANYGEGIDYSEYEEFTYDEDGRLIVHSVDAPNLNNEVAPSQSLIYTYGSDGRVAEILTQNANRAGTLVDFQKDQYEYDEAGNVTSVTTLLANTGWRPTQAAYYFFDYDITNEDVVYPEEPEEMFTNSLLQGNYNMVVRDSLCQEYEGEWGTYNINEYEYDSDPGTGIEEQVNDDNASESLSVTVLGDRIYVAGIAEGETIRIYDCSGRLIITGRYTEGGIPAYDLPEGVKILKAGKAAGKFL